MNGDMTRGLTLESNMAGPSATIAISRCRRMRIPCVPLHTTTTTTTSEIIDVPDDDHDESEFKFESDLETNDDVEGEDTHAISTSRSSDDWLLINEIVTCSLVSILFVVVETI